MQNSSQKRYGDMGSVTLSALSPCLSSIGVARILIGGGPNHKSHAMTSSEIFKKGTFVGQRYRRMEDLKL